MLGKMAAATLLVATVLGASAAPRAAGGGDQQGAVAAAGAAPALQMHWLGADTQARCMDGSRYGYYFRPASSAAGAKNWVIEMQGGGWW